VVLPVIRNPESAQNTAPGPFEPLIGQERRDKLLAALDARAGTQRGKPQSHDPAKNPLGCRVVAMDCGGPMYRVPAGASFRYTCGLYQQSHGQQCNPNHEGGLTATRFLLGCGRVELVTTVTAPPISLKHIRES
jgi:hypothetical protein